MVQFLGSTSAKELGVASDSDIRAQMIEELLHATRIGELLVKLGAINEDKMLAELADYTSIAS